MTPTPLLSVVIPVFNGAQYLAAAVESIRGGVCGEPEIIVVDDGSTDGTPEVARSLGTRVRYVRQDNQGPPAARNAGLLQARGDLLALLDADDLWPASKIDCQAPVLLENPTIDLVYGYTQHFRDATTATGETVIEYADPMVIVQLGAALFRRRAFDAVGSFDPALRYGDDVDWMLRAREAHLSMVFVEHVTIYYRRHATNMTVAPGHRSLGMAAMLKRSLDRRRAAGKGAASMAAWFERRPTPPRRGR